MTDTTSSLIDKLEALSIELGDDRDISPDSVISDVISIIRQHEAKNTDNLNTSGEHAQSLNTSQTLIEEMAKAIDIVIAEDVRKGIASDNHKPDWKKLFIEAARAAYSKVSSSEIPVHEMKIGFTCERTGKRWQFDSMTKFIEAFLDATQPVREIVDDRLAEAVAMADEARKYLLEHPSNKVKCNIMLLRLVQKFSPNLTEIDLRDIAKQLSEIENQK